MASMCSTVAIPHTECTDLYLIINEHGLPWDTEIYQNQHAFSRTQRVIDAFHFCKCQSCIELSYARGSNTTVLVLTEQRHLNVISTEGGWQWYGKISKHWQLKNGTLVIDGFQNESKFSFHASSYHPSAGRRLLFWCAAQYRFRRRECRALYLDLDWRRLTMGCNKISKTPTVDENNVSRWCLSKCEQIVTLCHKPPIRPLSEIETVHEI